MPFQYHILSDQGLIRVELLGEVTPQEVGDYRRAIAGEPEFSPTLPRLIDVRRIAQPPSTAEIREIAHTLLRPGPNIQAKRAIVAERDVIFGMFRMLESMIDRDSAPPVRVFRTEQEALSWLGVSRRGAAGSGPPLLH